MTDEEMRRDERKRLADPALTALFASKVCIPPGMHVFSNPPHCDCGQEVDAVMTAPVPGSTSADICACMGGTRHPCPDYPSRSMADWERLIGPLGVQP